LPASESIASAAGERQDAPSSTVDTTADATRPSLVVSTDKDPVDGEPNAQIAAHIPSGDEALRDLRSLWLVPTFLVAFIAALLFLAGQFHALQIHWQPLIAIALMAFIGIYVMVDRRSRLLSRVLERHAADLTTANDRLVALNAMGRTVAADLNLERVLQAICDGTEKALGADRVSVELASRVRGSGKGFGYPGRRPGSPLTLWSSGGATTEGDTSREPAPDVAAGVARLTMPIEGAAGDHLGTIRIFRTGRQFDTGDRELLTAIARQVSNAISNAQNYEASRRRSSDLRDLVLRGADAVAASDDISRIASLVSRQACKIVSCEGAGVFLFGDDRRLLSPVASVLADGRLVDGSRLASFYSRPIAIGDATLLKAVLASPGPLTVEDVTAFSEGRAWANYAGIGSMIAAPIVGRAHGTLGVLIVHWPERRARFDLEESGLVGALAAFAAVAIENAKLAAASKSAQRMLSERNERLLEETQRRRVELQKLVHRVGDALVAGLSCEKVAQLVVDQVRQMIPCHHAIFWVRETDEIFMPLTMPCAPNGDLNFGMWDMKSSRFLREAVENAHPIVVSDVAQDSRLAAVERTRLRRDEITSLLVAPLRGRGDQVIGLLALYWTSPGHTPTPEEFDTADVLATQAAAALENARLHNQLEEAERRLSAQLDQTTAARDFVERILQNVQAAVLVVGVGPEHGILRANALAESMPDVDQQRDGLVGRRFYDVFPGIESVVGDAMEEAFTQGEPVTLVDAEYCGFARGNTYWTFSFAPQRDPITRAVSQVILLALETTDRILLLRENERNARRVETLVHISQSLNATQEPSAIYSIVADGALALVAGLDRPQATLYVRDAASGRHILVASGGDNDPIEPSAALLRQLYASQTYLVADDLTAENAPLDDAANKATALLLPLMSQNTAIGHLVLTTETPRAFADIRLVDALVNLSLLSAAVIRNALAFAYEQNIAETLQKSFLPSMPAQMPGLSVAERYFPTLRNEAEIGGDYYDVIVLGPNKLAVFIGDISGKGLAAAVYTAMAKYTLRAFIAQEMSPLEIVSRANVAVARWTSHEIFSTLFFGVIDVERDTLTYVNAGHEPPILLRDSGGHEMLAPTGPTLGIFADSDFEVGETRLCPGDILTLYTDGLSDARDSSGNFFAEDGIRDHVESVRECSVDEICDSLHAKSVDYAAGHRLRDDVAMVVIKAERVER
jgi:serine phosphatase RsbU (regulator of sigma subunit)/GAF domain-containing protein